MKNNNACPEVSVLLPVFKSNIDHLKIAIDSILNQTYGDFEMLVLYEMTENDGLQDYLSSLKDERVHIIQMPKKSGLSYSLNVGIEKANGKYLARMDADDFSTSDRFKVQVEYLNRHPEIDVLCGEMQIMNSKEIMNPAFLSPEQRKARALFENPGVGHPTVVMRTDFLRDNHLKYDEAIGASEDYDLWTRMMSIGGNIGSVKQVVLEYRVHQEQASNVDSERIKKRDAQIRERYRKNFVLLDSYENQLLEGFCGRDDLNKSTKEYESVFLKLIHSYDDGAKLCKRSTLVAELSWQWLRKALIGNRKWEMMASKMGLRCAAPRNLWYILKNILWHIRLKTRV